MSRLPALFSLLLLAAACGSTATTTTTTESPPTGPPTTETIATTPTTAAPAPATSAPATTVAAATAFTLDDHIEWLVGVLNGAPLAEEDYQDRFGEDFKAQVPFPALAGPLEQFAGEWTIAEDDRSPDGRQASVLLTPASGTPLMGTFVLEPEPSGLLAGLLLQPGELPDPPESIDALAARWGELAPRAGFLAAEVSGELACTPLAAVESGRPLAIASVFKLWVLHAVAVAVESGDASWDEVLAVRDELKSLPSGIMQDEPAGTEFTLAEHAELMISISDNTATDHLIDHLGREAVEASVAATGHADPAANRPFFTTRELFWLKLAAPGDVVDNYLAGSEAERRALLDGADVDLAGVEPDEFGTPVAIDTLEWFASAEDVCRVLTILRSRFADSPAADALTANPGVRIDRSDWTAVAFKGGSEPGVLALAWHAERADGTAFVVVGILNDPEGPIDEISGVLLAEHAFTLLAAGG